MQSFYKRLLVWFYDSYKWLACRSFFSWSSCHPQVLRDTRGGGVSQAPSQLLALNAFRNASKRFESQTAPVEKVLRTISWWLICSHRSERPKANSQHFSVDWLFISNQSVFTSIFYRKVYLTRRMCSTIRRAYELSRQSPVLSELRDLLIVQMPWG